MLKKPYTKFIKVLSQRIYISCGLINFYLKNYNKKNATLN